MLGPGDTVGDKVEKAGGRNIEGPGTLVGFIDIEGICDTVVVQEGIEEGFIVCVGTIELTNEGSKEGIAVGAEEFIGVGATEGVSVGAKENIDVGADEGYCDGTEEGAEDGAMVGTRFAIATVWILLKGAVNCMVPFKSGSPSMTETWLRTGKKP